ncbi:uncharacterized protein LOC114720884 [Neltuma alba]|uniref:uncharacterized protein LOC114720884 n=1 Tax=Neltuma alba TaxID=207710 RepID=UPI0010A394DC|nr:uncharacterized protein LOC114720884 [Prosopis alba]
MVCIFYGTVLMLEKFGWIWYHPQFFAADRRDWFALNLKKDMGRYSDDNGTLCGELPSGGYGYGATVKEFNSTNTRQNPHHSLLWQPPSSGWVKLNGDGAMSSVSMRAGYGGVLRDSTGCWIAGFTHHLGVCGAYEAEDWAVFKGLSFA